MEGLGMSVPLVAILLIPTLIVLRIVFRYNRNIRRMNAEELVDPSKTRRRKLRFALKLPKGDKSIKIYTYDGEPLMLLPAKSELMLIVLPGTKTMKSVYTDTVWVSDGCVAYEDRPIGFMTDGNYLAKKLRMLSEERGAIVVHAEIRGYDRCGGWPIIYLKVPNAEYLNRLMRFSGIR